MSDDSHPTGAIVPLSPDGDMVSTPDPWHLLAAGEAALVSWSNFPERQFEAWGPVLRASSSLAQQLTTVATRAGAQSIVSAGTTLFRLELPTGSTLQSLVPAVGGGFRGLVRAGGSPAIAGHARLIPVSGAAVGAGIALGPLIGLLALSVGAEMLARRQQDRKLEAIQEGINVLIAHQSGTEHAQLESAEDAMSLSSAALLDRIEIPQAIGLGPARDNLRVIKNRLLGDLARWEKAAASLSESGSVDFDDMRHTLAGPKSGDQYKSFPEQVVRLYHSVVLDCRANVLTATEATLGNPDASLHHLEAQLQQRLDDSAHVQDRLRALLWRLAEAPVRVSYLLSSGSTERAVERLDRVLAQLAAWAAQAPDAPALLTPTNRQILEAVREPDGSLQLVRPA